MPSRLDWLCVFYKWLLINYLDHKRIAWEVPNYNHIGRFSPVGPFRLVQLSSGTNPRKAEFHEAPMWFNMERLETRALISIEFGLVELGPPNSDCLPTRLELHGHERMGTNLDS